MASSSLSQEDYEHDFELSSRRSKIRTARAANPRAVPMRPCGDVGTLEADGDMQGHLSQSLTAHPMDSENTILSSSIADHDASPKPLSRSKDKRCTRTNHINKGKVQRERRKLREKRRSTGVVHLQSTESTGGSTGEDDESLMSTETKRNTALNEAICKEESTEPPTSQVKSYPRLNKSPSDLDADDEDNQEYDSTLNHSDSTVSLVQDNHVSATGDGDQQDGDATDDILDEGGQNGHPTSSTTAETEESLEKLLHSAKEEIRNLLEQSKEKDHKISLLEQKINTLNRELLLYDAQNKKLLEENRSLLNALAELKT